MTGLCYASGSTAPAKTMYSKSFRVVPVVALVYSLHLDMRGVLEVSAVLGPVKALAASEGHCIF